MLYFIQEGDNGPIKIGISSNPQKRLEQLQTANPRKLNLLHVDDSYRNNGKGREDYLHERFGYARLNGEWFSPVPDLVEHIKYMAERGKGEDRTGEVLEPGDYVSFQSDRLVSFGSVISAADSPSGEVIVITSDGKIQKVRCNVLLVHSKHIIQKGKHRHFSRYFDYDTRRIDHERQGNVNRLGK